MATGGGFVRSIDIGCDVCYDYCCTPCSSEGRNVEATNFCVECDDHFCDKCVQFHHRFGKMKTHQILDQAGMKARGPQQASSLPTERCQLHHGNILDTFCVKHDEVCCSTCVSLHHKLCEGIEYLPTAAEGILNSKELKDVKSGIQNLQLQLNKLKNKRQDELLSLDADKKAILTEIQDFRKRVMKRLDELENVATDELQTKHQKLQDQINDDIKRLEEMLKCLDKSRNKLKMSDADSASETFVNVKTGKKNAIDGNKLLHEIEIRPKNSMLKFKVDPSIEDYMNTQKSLGEILEYDEVCSASLYREFDMRVSNDKHTCNITGSCVLDNGTVLVVDYNNARLKRLVNEYQVRDYCNLSSYPYVVCATGQHEVAVLHFTSKTVQFVSVGDKMALTRSFNVQGDYRYCQGMAYNNNQLFVSCARPAALLVYSMSGTPLKTIQQDTTGQDMFSSPRRITLSRDHTKIHIADFDKGLLTLGIHGDNQSGFTDPELKSATGVCIGNNDEILVCGYYSKSIIQIGRGSSKLGVLEESDGIKNPQSLCWDKANSRLIVTMFDTNHIKVFDMYKK